MKGEEKMEWLKKILLDFFYEIDQDGMHSDEELEHYADRCVEQIERTLSARRDFKGKEKE